VQVPNGHCFEQSNTCRRVNCIDCLLRQLCLPARLEPEEIRQLSEIIRQPRPLQKGEYLFRAGDPAQQFFVLRSGAVKACLLNNDGAEQITAIYLPGELIGLNSFGLRSFPNYALALEPSQFCSIPLPQLEELAGRIGKLRQYLLRLFSREILSDNYHLQQQRGSAEQRVLNFLLNFSERNAERGLSPTFLQMPLSRTELANYLGLTTETTSRMVTRFVEQGLIEVDRRHIHILDMPRMQHGQDAGNQPTSCPG
jgi:CRP/FNR family transcriptional regulator